ncbi:MAG: hypothetical protein V4670_12225 [Bacteroidota bacterium]
MNDLISKLNEQQIFSVKGESYKKPYLSNIFNGRESNKSVENVIFELYLEKKQELTKMNVERNELLQNKKPEAVTSGSN